MEKRNVVEEKRTPCKRASSQFCDCPKCQDSQKKKQAAEQVVSIDDTEGLARIHA